MDPLEEKCSGRLDQAGRRILEAKNVMGWSESFIHQREEQGGTET